MKKKAEEWRKSQKLTNEEMKTLIDYINKNMKKITIEDRMEISDKIERRNKRREAEKLEEELKEIELF